MTDQPNPLEQPLVEQAVESLTRPIIGIENRTPQEAFDIMCDRIRHATALKPAERPADQGGVGAIPADKVGAVSEDAIKHLEIRSHLNRAIYKAVCGYRMSNMSDADDPACSYPLVDLMSNPAPSDIGTGEMEMVALVDEIEAAVTAALAKPVSDHATDVTDKYGNTADEYRDALSELVSLDSEARAIGGGPGYGQRLLKAYAVAEELVRVEP
jgi:hypothetical protein